MLPKLQKPAAWMGAALLLAALSPLAYSDWSHDDVNVNAQMKTENGQQVKVFDLSHVANHRCELSDGTMLKYFEDGSVTLDGKLKCDNGVGKTERDVDLNVGFLRANEGHRQFAKKFDRDVFTKHDWVEWKAQELGNAKTTEKWNDITRVRVDFDN